MFPIVDKAKEGRLNPKGIPYIYLSSDKDTALAESRPWIGEYISLGTFITLSDLKIVDFNEPIYYNVIHGFEGKRQK